MKILKINEKQLSQKVTRLAEKARAAAIKLALADTATKNTALLKMAEAIGQNHGEILKQNTLDMKAAAKGGQTQAFLDRLQLDETRIRGMAEGLKEIAALPDPIGEVLREWSRPNGLKIKQVTVPIGVIGMIYEARPNVTVESAGLCLKSGNAVILRGGSEAFHTNALLVRLISDVAVKTGIPPAAIQFLPPQDRRSTTVLSQLTGLVDLIIARGSEEMIKKVSAQATVPVLGHGKGVCHVYVDESADVEKAVNIAYNAKVQRPGVCNAMEALLIHQDVLNKVLPQIKERYEQAGVEMRGDDQVTRLIPSIKKATPKDWGHEFHDKIVAIKVVSGVQAAIDHINKYGSGHTDAIITENAAAASLFQRAVDSSCVMVNASTRLHDGGVFGFGSEIGISTNKLHARGTMGLTELTSKKFLVTGSGQIRE